MATVGVADDGPPWRDGSGSVGHDAGDDARRQGSSGVVVIESRQRGAGHPQAGGAGGVVAPVGRAAVEAPGAGGHILDHTEPGPAELPLLLPDVGVHVALRPPVRLDVVGERAGGAQKAGQGQVLAGGALVSVGAWLETYSWFDQIQPEVPLPLNCGGLPITPPSQPEFHPSPK